MRPHGPGGAGPRRPIIGITPDFAQAPDAPAKYEVKVAYAEAVLRAGGLPFIVPYSDDPTTVDAYLDRIFGLVVTGGAFDIPPAAYGEQPREGLGTLKPGRTAFESALMQAALRRNLPVLGICGGMQLLHVLLGGTLFQDIRRELPSARDHEQQHDRSQPAHPVEVKGFEPSASTLRKCQSQPFDQEHFEESPGDDVAIPSASLRKTPLPSR